MTRCPIHPRYRGRGLPTECETCWALYGRAAAKSAVRSVGHARGGGQSSKAKGRSAVLLVAQLLRETLNLAEADVYVKATSQIGADIHLSPLALERFPCAIEVKCVESLNIWAALRQAGDNAGEHTPIVFFKRARTEMYIAMKAADFLYYVWKAHQLDLQG